MTEDQISSVSVLDASAFFLDLKFSGKIITTPEVVEEIKDLKGKARLSVLISTGLYVCSPDMVSKEIVKSESKKTGDGIVLSETDISILALAYETGGILFSDDFAVQNTAQQMEIKIQSILQRKAKKRIWRYRCVGCGKYFNDPPDDLVCRICGSSIKRKNK
jgi:endoribonuclease Nob1